MGTFNPAGKSPKATQVKTNAGKSQPCLLFPLQAACLQRNSGLENSKKGRREEGFRELKEGEKGRREEERIYLF